MNKDIPVLTDVQQANGRTVKASHYSYGGAVKILFTDGSFLIVQIKRGEYGDSDSLTLGDASELSDWDEQFFGLIDLAERTRRQEARDAETRKRQEDYERKQWQQLNAKFGAK